MTREDSGAKPRQVSLGILLSGTGTTLQNLIDKIERGDLPARIEFVLSSKPNAYGITRARKAGLPVETVDRKEFKDMRDFGLAVNERIFRYDIDLIVLAGYSHLLILDHLRETPAINIHPALIPAFCGKGYYGDRVHKAVLEYGVKITGVTVHFVDDQYDHGPIILQEAIRVRPDDAVDSLRSRVQRVEHRLYPEAIKLFAAGRLRREGGRVRILPQRKAT